MADAVELEQDILDSDVPHTLDSKYQLQLGTPIQSLAKEFSQAYPALSNTGTTLCAIVYEKDLPVPLNTIEALKKVRHPNFSNIIDAGTMTISSTNAERYVVVCDMPSGVLLYDFVRSNGALSEAEVGEHILIQIAGVIHALNEVEVVHGLINPHNLWYDQDSGKISVGPCFGEFCGYSQPTVFESLDRAICHRAGKGDHDYSCDWFAMGMVLLYLLAGRYPFEEIDDEHLIQNMRLEHGSYDSAIEHLRTSTGQAPSFRMDNLLKGLLTDDHHERWNWENIQEWLHRRDSPAPASKQHKQATSVFLFNEKEFVGRKYLAHDIASNWNTAKRNIKLVDVARWISLALKLPNIGEIIEALAAGDGSGVILPDEKLTRLITILDPDGPIRFHDFNAHINGIGSFLAWCHMKDQRDSMQQLGSVFHDGLIENWINRQPDQEEYSPMRLGWSPSRIRHYIRKRGLGFGIERGLYDLNPGLPCQSELLGSHYATTLPDMLKSLDAYTGNKEETDPVDRHIAAFIGSRIELDDEIRVKSLMNFAYLGKNPQLRMLALLTVAQSESRIKSLKGLSEWMNTRLSTLLESLNSNLIRKEIKGKLQVAAKEGKMNALFKILAHQSYARRDMYGFREARKHYRTISNRIQMLRTQSNIQRLAYQYGLRISVTLAYLVCIVTMLYVLFTQTG